MILKDGEHWEPENEQVIKWQQAYKDIDVYSELDSMSCWCDANPSKRKTRKGIERFVNSWLKRANQTGGSPPIFSSAGNAETEKRKLKQWDSIDDITHDFMNSEAWRTRMLQEHGRYMSADGERVYAK